MGKIDYNISYSHLQITVRSIVEAVEFLLQNGCLLILTDIFFMICLQTDNHFRCSILSEITWPVLSIFFPFIRIWKELICQPGESFVIFISIRFQKWYGFLLMLFSKLLLLRQSKNWSKNW